MPRVIIPFANIVSFLFQEKKIYLLVLHTMEACSTKNLGRSLPIVGVTAVTFCKPKTRNGIFLLLIIIIIVTMTTMTYLFIIHTRN